MQGRVWRWHRWQLNFVQVHVLGPSFIVRRCMSLITRAQPLVAGRSSEARGLSQLRITTHIPQAVAVLRLCAHSPFVKARKLSCSSHTIDPAATGRWWMGWSTFSMLPLYCRRAVPNSPRAAALYILRLHNQSTSLRSKHKLMYPIKYLRNTA